jgi:endogenous inhibitor of DNA gyrase (YacG/DUF329 family)
LTIKKAGCPICGKPIDPAFRPFCSKRCADVDLGRWLNESYVVPEPVGPDEASDLIDDESDDTVH